MAACGAVGRGFESLWARIKVKVKRGHGGSSTKSSMEKGSFGLSDEDNYNYDSLNYLIDIMNGFYSAYKRESEKMHLTGQLEEKKRQMIRYEVTAKFCHYAETPGAFIYGFHTQQSVIRRESKILSTISDYKVRQIDDEYKLLTKGRITTLWKIQEQSLKHIFGYYKTVDPQYSNAISDSLNFIDLFSIIAGLLILVTITSLTSKDSGADVSTPLIFPNPVTNLEFNMKLIEEFMLAQSEDPRDD